MTKAQFIKKYGDKKTKEAASALHLFLAGYSMDEHYELESKIISYGNMKIKESFEHIEPLLEFSEEE